MAPKPPDHAVKKAKRYRARKVAFAIPFYGTTLKPFQQTHFGRLPPELRERVFIELLATPPQYAGHDLLTDSPRPKKLVHIKASWYHVTGTCRQIYHEAHPLFFASKTYYLASAEEVRSFTRSSYPRRPFRYDTITRLCLKDLVESCALYSKERIDEILSDPTSFLARNRNRQDLEAEKYESIKANVLIPLMSLTNLQTLGLCFRVGEETEHINFLYGLTGLTKGLVEFLDANHWMMRPQNAEDVWNMQYAGFFNADWGLNKDGERIPFLMCDDQQDVADIDSRAPGLREGDERYVEVQLPQPAKQNFAQPHLSPHLYGYESGPFADVARSDHSDMELQVPIEAQPEVPRDPTEEIVRIEAIEIAETSEEISMAEQEPESNRTNQSSVLAVQREASNALPPDSATEEGEDHAVTNSTSEDVSSTEPENVSNLQVEDPPLSRLLGSVTSKAPTENNEDGDFLRSTDEEDIQAQTDTNSREPAPEPVNFPMDNEFYGDSATEEDQVQDPIKEKKKGAIRRTKLKQALSQDKPPLSKILVTPSPYTEEEMESFETGQQLAISKNQEWTRKGFHQSEKPLSPSGRMQEQDSQDSEAANEIKTPEKMTPSPAWSGLPSNSVQVGGAFLLLLLLGILNLRLPIEGPPTTSPGRKDT